jgi:hypothetical protein
MDVVVTIRADGSDLGLRVSHTRGDTGSQRSGVEPTDFGARAGAGDIPAELVVSRVAFA